MSALAACFICQNAIEVGEPFGCQSVIPEPGIPAVMIPMHMSCSTLCVAEELAGIVLQSLDEPDDGPAVRISAKGTPRNAPLRVKLAHLAVDWIAEHLNTRS